MMQPILLLHGAIGARDQLAELEERISGSFLVHRIDFSGHGGSPDMDKPFSIKLFAMDVIEYLDRHEIKTIRVFGYSMGGYVAIYLAKHFPQRIDKIITLATKFRWDKAIAAKEVNMLDAATIEEKLPAFATVLQKRHTANTWKTVLEKTASLLIEMGNDNPLKPGDFATITQPILLMLGDRDNMVTLDETLEVYKALPYAQMAVLPNTPHPVERVNADRLAYEIMTFLL